MEATPIVIGHWLRQRHPQRWPTLKVSLYLSISIFPFAFNTLPWLLGFFFFFFFFFFLSFFYPFFPLCL
jgi:hypothetical protein